MNQLSYRRAGRRFPLQEKKRKEKSFFDETANIEKVKHQKLKLSVAKDKMCAKLGLYVSSFLLLMASSEDTDSLHD